jgi:hypothetical protein
MHKLEATKASVLSQSAYLDYA